MKNYHKTKFRLETAIENADRIDGMQDYLDMHFACLMFDLDCGSSPTWDEAMAGELFPPAYWMLEGSIDYAISGRYDYNPETLMAEYVSGHYEPHNYGDIIKKEGNQYRYIASIGLSNEMEHQSDDGGFVYEYRGSSFVRILEPIEEIIQKHYPV